MNGPELVKKQLLLRGVVRQGDIKEMLKNIPAPQKQIDACKALLVKCKDGVCLRVEQELVDSVREKGILFMNAAPAHIRLYWRELKQQTRRLPVKLLEGGGVAINTKLGASGKMSLLSIIERSSEGVEAAVAAFDYPGAQQHVLDLIAESLIVCRGSHLFGVE